MQKAIRSFGNELKKAIKKLEKLGSDGEGGKRSWADKSHI